MHRPIFGHSFAVLVAPILLSALAFYFLNKKTRARKNAEDADTGASDLVTAPTGTNSGGSSSSPTDTNNSGSSSSTAPTGNHYEVFLSFRGDTRKGFTDHLYKGLINAGICTFRDEEELRQGEKIRPDLLEAIKNSKILIPILSVNYGTSSWCLDELVQIMECKNGSMGHVVLPIFYKVEPAHVRHQIGSFGGAFHERERRLCERGFDPAILKKWKQALVEVSSLKGWDAEGYEAELVKSVVQQVLFELKKIFELVTPENLIGIDSHVEKVMNFVDNTSRATLFVGIYGMGGIGKTTLAKTIYNKLFDQFEYRSFIADTRESCKRNGVHYLQNQLLYDMLKQENQARNEDEGIRLLSSMLKSKKVLVLLDDVDDDDQLKALAGNHNWFSPGSVIIITTRDESILDKACVYCKHEHKGLDKDESLILFSRHVFRRDTPPSEFKELTDEVLSTTGGLPLSLKVLGSLFCGKEAKEWGGLIDKLKKVPHEKVQEKLKISYEALDHGQRQIFLDIACFFIGTDWRIASYMWDACGFYSKWGIEVLRFKSLIKVEEDHKLRMHDQLRDLGRLIVCEGNENEPEYRSRLWDSEEAWKVLEENEGTEKIEAIHLCKYSSKGFGDNIFTGERFEKLRKLRFLDAEGAHFSGDFKNSFKKLKWLQWQGCPSTFEASNFHVKELVVLNMHGGRISDKWEGWRSITMAKKLKYLDLSFSHIEETFFLSAFENLEVLILNYCQKIKQIDSSVGNMKSLVHLNLTGCERLEGLPEEVGKLKALEQLCLLCSGIRQLPDCIGDLQNLEILIICGTKIEELPNSIWDLQNLKILNMHGSGIKELPNGIGRLRKLQDLSASACYQLGGEIPESICNLSSLQSLHLHDSKKLQSLPMLPSSLKNLNLTCQSRRLPSLSNLIHLKKLRLHDCQFLECIWEHPSTLLEECLNSHFELEILIIHCCGNMKTLDVSQFNHLRTLSAKSCHNILEIRGLDKLEYLERLEINGCNSIKRLDLPKFKRLKILIAQWCKNLVEIQGLDKSEFLKKLDILQCTSIERLDLPKSKSLKVFNAKYCSVLVEIQGLNRLESLEEINISWCASIRKLELPKSEDLKVFKAEDCKSLVAIEGRDELESLEEIDISCCTSIQWLDLGKSKSLKKLSIGSCNNLSVIQGLNRLESLEVLNMCECSPSERLSGGARSGFLAIHDIRIQNQERLPSCTNYRDLHQSYQNVMNCGRSQAYDVRMFP